jgi:hypothetical protein
MTASDTITGTSRLAQVAREIDPLAVRHWALRLPIVRGVVALGESLSIGFRALSVSANYAAVVDTEEERLEGEEPAELSRWALVFSFAVAIGFALGAEVDLIGYLTAVERPELVKGILAVETSPGAFDVVLLSSEQKYGRDWEGGHTVAIEVAGQKLRGQVDSNGKEENPANPYWKYVISRIGRVTIDKAGRYHLTLKPETILAAKKLGLTLVSVELRPFQN